MSKTYVVKNQHGLFADKHKEWVDGREPKLLFKTLHKDEAINMVFELSSKDINVRAEAIEVGIDDNKLPIVEVTAPPPPKEDPDQGQQAMLMEDAAVTGTEDNDEPVIESPLAQSVVH